MNDNLKNIKSKKIRELADSCVHRSKGDFGLIIEGGVDIEKFARLILENCKIAINATTESDKHDIIENIETHFDITNLGKHHYASVDPAEWSDTYRCTRCNHTVVYDAEDCMSSREAEKRNGACKGWA